MSDQHTPTDPTRQHPRPAQPGRTLHPPGLTGDMARRPDHGEDSYVGTGKLTGRRAVITGGDSGIGRAVAIAFAREGADVVLSYLPEEETDAQVTAGHVADAGRRAVAFPGDVQDPSYCRALVERAVADLGGIDILVNNAAYQMSKEHGLADVTYEELDRTFKTNVYALFLITQAALPHLRPGSTVINTSSVQATRPSPELIDYAATKAAVVSFTQALAQQVADQGIRVNTVAPGPIWTPLIPATMPEEKVRTFGADTPEGRAGQPAELAPAYVFLASQESSYITGERLAVTGGKITP